MPGSVQLVCGDLLDGPADLVVLPCSTAGTVTHLVANKLERFSLPTPTPMRLGAVQVLPLEDARHLAQFAAFAASVAAFTSSPETIATIGAALGQATHRSPAIRIVNAPLLGAGAGGLASEVVVENLRKGFLAEAVADAVLNIYVLHADVYRKLLSAVGPRSAPGEETPEEGAAYERTVEAVRSHDETQDGTAAGEVPLRVLISYTSNSPQQKQWVEDLYRFLRQNGIDARLDTYSLRLGGDVVQWMCNELQLANRVVLVCDERYAKLADGRHGGVGWETMLIQGDLFMAMYGREQMDAGVKYIPIVRTESLDEGRPTFLATKRVLHWPPGASSEERRRELLRELYEVKIEPPLGPRPSRL
jgi:hypothetical protein